ncbi:MAG TPA: hypothetical protein VNK04_07900 [Gemmataceae bacterium]|nr:hypothetical protein [Gemmataceae bacterium]
MFDTLRKRIPLAAVLVVVAYLPAAELPVRDEPTGEPAHERHVAALIAQLGSNRGVYLDL